MGAILLIMTKIVINTGILNQMVKTCLFEYKTTFLICIFVLSIHKGFM